jgi:hypothetical protein
MNSWNMSMKEESIYQLLLTMWLLKRKVVMLSLFLLNKARLSFKDCKRMF